jgi:hypothetical protein
MSPVLIGGGFDNAAIGKFDRRGFLQGRALGGYRGQPCIVAALHCGVARRDGLRDRRAELVGDGVVKPMGARSVNGAIGQSVGEYHDELAAELRRPG